MEMVDAARLIALLDEAGIRQAAVLSLAYMYGNPNRPPVEREYDAVKAENDWTSAQVAKFPDRLVAFCSVNPLRPYALEEMARCADGSAPEARPQAALRQLGREPDQSGGRRAAARGVRAGQSAAHGDRRPRPHDDLQAASVRRGARARLPGRAAAGGARRAGADRAPRRLRRLRRSGPRRRGRRVRGRDRRQGSARAPGCGSTSPASPASGTGRGRRRASPSASASSASTRVLWGADGAAGGNTPAAAWKAFSDIPLTPAELETIRTNVAPYLK